MKIEIQEKEILKIEIGDLVKTGAGDIRLVTETCNNNIPAITLIDPRTCRQTASDTNMLSLIRDLNLTLIAKKENLKLIVIK